MSKDHAKKSTPPRPNKPIDVNLQNLTRAQRKNVGRNRKKKSTAGATEQAGSTQTTTIADPSIPSSTDRPSTPPPRVQTEGSEGQASKRSVTAIATAESPEYKRAPERKRSKLNLNTDVEDEVDKGAVSIKPSRRGKRGSRKNKNWKRNQKRRFEDAICLIEACKTFGQPIHGDKEISALTPEEAIDLAKGYHLTMSQNGNDKVFSFDIEEHAKRWQKKNSVKPGQFKGKVMTSKDIDQYNFRVFKQGAIYAYAKDTNGKEELRFSAIFRPFKEMNKEEKSDTERCAAFFAELYNNDGPFIDKNEAHNVPDADGVMMAIGQCPGFDKGYCAGTYARPNEDSESFKKLWEKQSHCAEFFGRKFKAQSPALHGHNNNLIKQFRLPRIDDKQLGLKDGTSAPASNLTITCLDFSNAIHVDKDVTKFMYGQWLPTYADGRLVEDPEEVRSMTQGGFFVLPDYGIAIDFSKCPGVVSLTWRGPLGLYGTTKSTTKPGYFRWGTLIQCTKCLNDRIKLQRRTLAGERIKQGKDAYGRTKYVTVSKIKDYYYRTGEPRPELPNVKWWLGEDESDLESEEEEVRVLDCISDDEEE
ncbi:hypothetical protein FRC07_005572 [Ceratobasidium sp. 392]|nr:hypothetical protein FRC07_005572 [Ceratobasidium sp. 392]